MLTSPTSGPPADLTLKPFSNHHIRSAMGTFKYWIFSLPHMNKILIFVLLAIILTACVPEAKNLPDTALGCKQGFVSYGNGCCEDRDGDKICDPNGQRIENSNPTIVVQNTVTSNKNNDGDNLLFYCVL